MSWDKASAKGIEKYLDPSKMDIELLPDIDNDSVGKFLYVDEDGELRWNSVTSDSLEDIYLQITITKEKLEVISKSLTQLETDFGRFSEEIITSLEIEFGRIEASFRSVNELITNNKDLFDKFVDDTDAELGEINKIMNSINTSIEVLNSKISLVVSEKNIVGAYNPGRNDIPTIKWQNQTNPLKSATLNNFLFEQDSGWILSSNNINECRLMMSGTQTLTVDNLINSYSNYSRFSIDAWIRPYSFNEALLMDFIYLCDYDECISIRSEGINVRTFIQLNLMELNHICITIDSSINSYNIYLNGIKLELFSTITSKHLPLPNVLTFFSGFDGDVSSFKVYNSLLDEDSIIKNFNEGHTGYNVVKYDLDGYFEARCAEAVYSNFNYTESLIEILKDSISLKVSKDQYEKDINSVTERLDEAELKIKPESIIITVTSSEEYIKDKEDILSKIKDIDSTYSITLSNEAQVISTDYNRYPISSNTYTVDITVYNGTVDITGKCTIIPPESEYGITVEKQSNNTLTFSVVNTIPIGTTDIQDGTFDIQVTIPDVEKSFTKSFSWAISKQGDSGQNGTSITMKGYYTLEQWLIVKEELSKTAKIGDGYSVDGNLYVFDGIIFVDCGSIKGEDGDNAKFVKVSGEQCFKYENSNDTIPTPNTITLTGLSVNIPNPIFQWAYKTPDNTNYINIVGANNVIYTVMPDDIIWGEYKQLTFRCTCNLEYYDEITLVKVFDGDNGYTYRLEIVSTNGNIFKNGNINTTLHAILYKNERNITDETNSSCFKWTKINSDGSHDNDWNTVHFGGAKSVDITSDDVFSRASFVCNVDI